MNKQPNSFRNGPDERGHFGQFGGRYVAETLMPLILDLEREYRAAQADPEFQREFDDLIGNDALDGCPGQLNRVHAWAHDVHVVAGQITIQPRFKRIGQELQSECALIVSEIVR